MRTDDNLTREDKSMNEIDRQLNKILNKRPLSTVFMK